MNSSNKCILFFKNFLLIVNIYLNISNNEDMLLYIMMSTVINSEIHSAAIWCALNALANAKVVERLSITAGSLEICKRNILLCVGITDPECPISRGWCLERAN